MRPFTIAPIAAVFACCLALIFPMRTMAGVTTQTNSCPRGEGKQMPDKGWGCVIPLHVRQPIPGGGGGSGPNDWGMCGVLSVSGTFGTLSVAEIIVEPSGYYSVELEGNTKSLIPTLDSTCVLFSDFTGVPPPADAMAVPPPVQKYDAGIVGGSQAIFDSPGRACIWAGLSGDVENPTNDGGFGYSFAQYFGPATKLGSLSATSYAWCSGYTASWRGWKYLRHGNGLAKVPHVTPIGLNSANDFCYTNGIQTKLKYGNYRIGAISGGLKLSSGNYSIYATPAGGVLMDYNCLPLKQN